MSTNDLTIYKPDDVEYLPDEGRWTCRFPIPSESSKNIYIVSKDKTTGLWGCSCPRWRVKRICKHLLALGVPTPPKLLGSGTKKSGKKAVFANNYEQYDTSGGFGDSSIWQGAFAERMGLTEATRLVGGESPFVILGVGSKSAWDLIRKAYRKLAMQFHPDRNPGDKQSEESFKRVQAAWEILEEQHSKGLIL